MPQMVLNRNYYLTSTTGHSIAFEKGIPVGVPPPLVPKALEIGAELVDTPKDAFVPEEPKRNMAIPSGDDRETAIFEAFRQIVERNDATDFTAGQKPRFKVVSQIAGFSVNAVESADMWARYNEMQKALANAK